MVDFAILLGIVENCLVKGKLLSYIENYLDDTKQSEMVDNVTSYKMLVIRRVSINQT